MSNQRRPFLPISNDVDDVQLEQLARQKGVGKFETPRSSVEGEGLGGTPSEQPTADMPVTFAPLKTLNLELPGYVWTALKIRAAERQTSLKHVVMKALVKDGFTIKEADLIEDGRRLRGSNRTLIDT